MSAHRCYCLYANAFSVGNEINSVVLIRIDTQGAPVKTGVAPLPKNDWRKKHAEYRTGFRYVPR